MFKSWITKIYSLPKHWKTACLLSKLSLEWTGMVLVRGQAALRGHGATAYCRNTIMYCFQFPGTYYLADSKMTSFLSFKEISNADMLYSSLWRRQRFGEGKLAKLVFQEVSGIAGIKSLSRKHTLVLLGSWMRRGFPSSPFIQTSCVMRTTVCSSRRTFCNYAAS